MSRATASLGGSGGGARVGKTGSKPNDSKELGEVLPVFAD